MRERLGIVAALSLVLAGSVPGTAQERTQESPGTTDALVERLIGEVTASDPTAKRLTIKVDGGATATVILQDKTLYLRVPPGETDLKKATTITPDQIGVGDRVYARGRLAEDRKSIPAVAIIVMTKADLAQKRERDRADWQKRAVAGTITALKPDTQEITVSVRSREGAKALIIESSHNAVFRRYAADSVQFGQARPSSFGELNVGDSLRILGEKNSDGTRIKSEEIVSGSFRNIPGLINAIDAAGREIRMTDLQSKRQLTVRITPETMVRRMPPVKPAASPARPPQGGNSAAAGGADASSGRRSGPASPEGASSAGQPGRGVSAGAAGAAGAGPGKPPAQKAPQGGPSLDVERMLAVKLGDLKQGDAVIVLCTVGAEPSRVTAIVMLAGVEALLAQTPEGAPQIGGAWDFFDISLP
jgi:hypothetical protein